MRCCAEMRRGGSQGTGQPGKPIIEAMYTTALGAAANLVTAAHARTLASEMIVLGTQALDTVRCLVVQHDQ